MTELSLLQAIDTRNRALRAVAYLRLAAECGARLEKVGGFPIVTVEGLPENMIYVINENTGQVIELDLGVQIG